MERFFNSLKAELNHQRQFTSDAQLDATLSGYTERFYSVKRMLSRPGYHSPIEFECLAMCPQNRMKITEVARLRLPAARGRVTRSSGRT